MNYYEKLQVDERGQAVIVTFNEQGQEVSRSSSGGGGGLCNARNNCVILDRKTLEILKEREKQRNIKEITEKIRNKNESPTP